jgi:hypothetical protein
VHRGIWQFEIWKLILKFANFRNVEIESGLSADGGSGADRRASGNVAIEIGDEAVAEQPNCRAGWLEGTEDPTPS